MNIDSNRIFMKKLKYVGTRDSYAGAHVCNTIFHSETMSSNVIRISDIICDGDIYTETLREQYEQRIDEMGYYADIYNEYEEYEEHEEYEEDEEEEYEEYEEYKGREWCE